MDVGAVLWSVIRWLGTDLHWFQATTAATAVAALAVSILSYRRSGRWRDPQWSLSQEQEGRERPVLTNSGDTVAHRVRMSVWDHAGTKSTGEVVGQITPDSSAAVEGLDHYALIWWVGPEGRRTLFDYPGCVREFRRKALIQWTDGRRNKRFKIDLY